MRSNIFILLCLLTIAGTGCTSTTPSLKSAGTLITDPGRLVGNPRCEKNVARIVTIWEPAHGKGLDDRNARGFAGQILFFGPGGKTGSRVHGSVRIYQYDNYDPDSDEDPTLLHTFAFEPEAWEAHRGEGTLGHSYSVFVPYMNKHREQVNCALKVEFVGEDGRVVSSQETEVLLPGRDTTELAASRTRGFVRQNRIGPEEGQQPVVYGSAPPEPHLDTMSIPLPKRR